MSSLKGSRFFRMLCVFATLTLALASVSFIVGCSEDEDTKNADGNGDQNGASSGDVAKIQIVGQAGLLPGSTGEVPKEVKVGTPVVLAVALFDKAGKPISGETAVQIYTAVQWKSSDPSVASIIAQASAALVTPLKPGKVTITATYKDKSASVEITVK